MLGRPVADLVPPVRRGHEQKVVLIGSDSLDTIRVTHANSFAPTGVESKYFAGLREREDFVRHPINVQGPTTSNAGSSG